MDDTTIGRAATVGALLRGRGQTIATAESCTGGALAAAFTANAGASEYFSGGVVAYSAALKVALLGVSPELIAEEGVVSAACALAMARGARQACGAELALATTGIAGPGGAEPGKPVGLVHYALAWPGGELHRQAIFPGDRAAVIATATASALLLALDHLRGAV